ncbi:hypothetical protein LTR36_002892 [Oleoguttula mirabilis]|uniref:Heterokaryon incompatibility domain-containing protein n=1 Tax=Oleoguttula mirabilis TaxID=1507867 RepID=A0AAV9JKL3_9PEZI|nr:hypothetical protein LTR36_002892 [Oleoguttula mirabilis]
MPVSKLRIKLIGLLPDKAPLQRLDSGVVVPEHGNKDSQHLIQCTLTSVDFDSSTTYTALSYTWGDPKVQKHICIDGEAVNVTVNLEAALRHLQKTISEPLILWIDAVCINQSDEAEKSEQVAHMRDIYSKAENVVTWLGHGGSALAMRWINEFGGRASGLGIGGTPDMLLKKVLKRAEEVLSVEEGDGGAMSDEQIFAHDLERGLSADLNPHYDELIAGLQDILKRAYWSRIWIVQEVTMAQNVEFVCGTETVAYQALHHSLRLLRNYRLWQLLKLGHDTTRPILVREDSGLRARVINTDPSHAIDLLKVSRAEGAMPMMYLLRRLQRFNATDPRDRVFALLGIATDAEELGVRPDYSKSWEQVYTELARVLLGHGYFDVLSHCIHEPHGDSSSLRLQTWVPVWSRKTTCSPLQQRALDRSQKPAVRTVLQPEFKASGSRCQPHPENVATLPWSEPLRLSAIIIGEIHETGNRWKAESLGDWFTTLQALAASPFSQLTEPCERAHAVWRTAVADQDIRRHNLKPRLPASTVAKLDKLLSATELTLVDGQMLANNGLGDYAESLHSIGQGRQPFLTSLGHLAVGPEEARKGDVVAVVLGAAVPYVLRRIEGERCIFIGEAYVHDCMDGQLAGPNAVVLKIALR